MIKTEIQFLHNVKDQNIGYIQSNQFSACEIYTKQIDSRYKYNLMKLLVVGVAYLLLLTVLSKQIMIRYSMETQSIDLFKYFHSLHNEFFVDIGAFDPIFMSNTVQLPGWSGLNLEASNKRQRNFLVSRLDQTSLNMAVTKVTGGYITLVEHGDEGTASVDTDFNKGLSTRRNVTLEEKVPQITMADLCHLYYPKRPKLMTLDIEGHGHIALTANDWTDQKCIPEVMCIQRIGVQEKDINQRIFLESKNYVLQSRTFYNQIYILKEFVDIYQQRKLQGEKILEKVQAQHWAPIFQQIFRLIDPNAQVNFQKPFVHMNPTNSLLYTHFITETIISVEEIRERSFFFAKKNRPILLMHYNPLKSKLYFGSSDYNITKITLAASNLILHKIQINYPNGKTQVYVFDHNIEAPRALQILDEQQKAADAKCKLNGN